jgi:hypothetical protein
VFYGQRERINNSLIISRVERLLVNICTPVYILTLISSNFSRSSLQQNHKSEINIIRRRACERWRGFNQELIWRDSQLATATLFKLAAFRSGSNFHQISVRMRSYYRMCGSRNFTFIQLLSKFTLIICNCFCNLLFTPGFKENINCCVLNCTYRVEVCMAFHLETMARNIQPAPSNTPNCRHIIRF